MIIAWIRYSAITFILSWASSFEVSCSRRQSSMMIHVVAVICSRLYTIADASIVNFILFSSSSPNFINRFLSYDWPSSEIPSLSQPYSCCCCFYCYCWHFMSVRSLLLNNIYVCVCSVNHGIASSPSCSSVGEYWHLLEIFGSPLSSPIGVQIVWCNETACSLQGTHVFPYIRLHPTRSKYMII